MIKKLFTGTHNSFVIDNNNFLYGAGMDTIGGLGLGVATRHCLNFTLIPTLPQDKQVISVAAASNFSYVLLDDNTLWVAGGRNGGGLGISSTHSAYSIFTLVTTLPQNKKINMIVAGYSHVLVLVEDGTLWGIGNNDDGELGMGHNRSVSQLTPIMTLPADKSIVSIMAGGRCSFVLLEDNSVVRGYFNYHAVSGNLQILSGFRREVNLLWLKSLRRRSQRHRMTWDRFAKLEAKYIPALQRVHDYPYKRFRSNTLSKSRMR